MGYRSSPNKSPTIMIITIITIPPVASPPITIPNPATKKEKIPR
jgi:hypothetical protein